MRKINLVIFFILFLISLNVALAEEICDSSSVGKTYCQDEKNAMVCSPSGLGEETTYSWVSVACGKCENGQCIQEKICPTTQTTCGDGITVVGCKLVNNECICSACPAQRPCTESDGGMNFNEKGNAKALAGELLNVEDACGSDGFLYEYYCVDDRIYLEKHLCPYGCSNGACIKEQIQTATCKDTDGTYIVSVTNGILHPPNQDRYVKGIVTYNGVTYEDSCGGMVYFTDSLGNNRIRFEKNSEDKGVFEVGCLDGKTPYETAYFECPRGCKNGACVTEEVCRDCTKERVKEQITCLFINSDKEQQCYIAGAFTGEDEGKKFCKGKETCIINYESFKGEKVTWKSTCGQYQYTAQDGINEQIKFECKTGETTITQIKDKNYRFVSFQCYDGEESKSVDREACKPVEFWKKFAENFCESHCKDSRELKCKKGENCISKCGVNTFSVLGECYKEETIATPIPTTPTTTQTEQGIPAEKEVPIPIQPELFLVCKDSCALEGKCYPFGYRKSGQYCSDIGKFVEQFKGDNKCDNNFECESNVCINSECMSQSFINKIISWLKKLFGSG